MPRRYVYREYGPPILWAWRLELEDSGGFTFNRTVYAGDDGTTSDAVGTWRESGGTIYLRARQSEALELLPVGEDVVLDREGSDPDAAIRLHGARLVPEND